MSHTFTDGIKNVFNNLINRRNVTANNIVDSPRLSVEQMKAIYRSGLGSKIIRIKAGQAVNDTITFQSSQDSEYYKQKLEPAVKKAAKFMIGFGRGIIVIHSRGDKLSDPLGKVDNTLAKVSVFSGDMVTAHSISLDLLDPRYLKPEAYIVRGTTIHWTRVIDFTYVDPVEMDLPSYQYGGISEFELIYNQIINDGIVERASPAIIEKASNFIYKIEGFKDALRQKKDTDLQEYIGATEDMRSIYGAVVIDTNDDVSSINQQITNLADVDQITLRRLAMVTGIPLSVLVGESVKGLNATGDNETKIYQDMLRGIQSDYLQRPINELMMKLGFGQVTFKANQGQTPAEKIAFDKMALDNAFLMFQMGEDGSAYLSKNGIIEPDNWEKYWDGEETN